MLASTNQNNYGYIDYFNTLSAVQIPQSAGVQSQQTQIPQVTLAGAPAVNSYSNVSAGNTNPALLGQQARGLKLLNDSNEYALNQRKEFDSSLLGQASPYVKMGTSVINAGASLASIYTGLEQLKLAKKAEARADEMWKEQLAELNHVRGVRKRINATYGGK